MIVSRYSRYGKAMAAYGRTIAEHGRTNGSLTHSSLNAVEPMTGLGHSRT